jgi:hypothetical protein
METKNEKIIRIFNEAVDSVECDCKNVSVDPYCATPNLILCFTCMVHGKVSGKQEKVSLEIDTGHINPMFFECEPDYIVRGWMRKRITRGIERMQGSRVTGTGCKQTTGVISYD